MNNRLIPKLQIALDDIALDEAISLLSQTADNIDIIEIGTPLLMRYGMTAVTELRTRFPTHTLLCDSKVMDAGSYESNMAFQAGADIATVLAVTDDLTIADCIAAANTGNKKIMADLICVTDLISRIQVLEKLGVHIFGIHTGVDQQAAGRTPLDDLIEIRRYSNTVCLSIAGGITEHNVAAYLPYHPNIVIAGGGIRNASDPVLAAKHLSEKIKEFC